MLGFVPSGHRVRHAAPHSSDELLLQRISEDSSVLSPPTRWSFRFAPTAIAIYPLHHQIQWPPPYYFSELRAGLRQWRARAGLSTIPCGQLLFN